VEDISYSNHNSVIKAEQDIFGLDMEMILVLDMDWVHIRKSVKNDKFVLNCEQMQSNRIF
jgi:hypothetical protein